MRRVENAVMRRVENNVAACEHQACIELEDHRHGPTGLGAAALRRLKQQARMRRQRLPRIPSRAATHIWSNSSLPIHQRWVQSKAWVNGMGCSASSFSMATATEPRSRPRSGNRIEKQAGASVE